MSNTECKECTLGDLSIDGKGYYGIGASAVPYNENLYTYLRITDINDDGTLNKSDLKSVDAEDAKDYLLKPNDIVFARTGASTGRNYFYDGHDGEFVYAGFLIKFSIDPQKVNPKYVKYYCQSENYKGWIQSFSTGSTRGNINAQTLANMPIIVPSRSQQDELVRILSSLDDKIELNNAINKNLEEQAQTLFKNWFIDYAPFGGEPLVNSPIEMKVPKSLKMIQIADYPHVLETGRRPKGGAVSEGIPSIGAENVKELGVFDYSSNKFIPKEFAESLGKGKIKGYEVLLYKDGGKPGTFIPHFSMFGEGFPYEECYINEHVFKLDFGDKALNIFAYFYFQTEYVVSWLANNGGKAAIPGINQNDVNAVWIYDLNNPKVKEFGEIVKPMFEQILKNCKQNQQLSILRDSILPKLMSGEN